MEIIFEIFHTAVCCVIANKNCEVEIILLYYIYYITFIPSMNIV